MPTDEEIHNDLLAMYSRLGAIEGKVNVIGRANSGPIRAVLEAAVRKQPLIGQIYLLLDGMRTQKRIVEALGGYGIATSEPTVSRRMGEMETEYGMIDLVQGGGSKIYRKDREMERLLNLSVNIRKWLADESQCIPEPPSRKNRKKA